MPRHGFEVINAGLGATASFSRPRDWQLFERLVRDLFVRISGDVHADLNGRVGQPQSGVDVSCTDQRTRETIGIQCKSRDPGAFQARTLITPNEFRAAVSEAKTFRPTLDRFVFVTTAPNDSSLKKLAASLTERHRSQGLFKVDFHGWDWVEAKLSEHIDLAVQYGLVAVLARAENGDSLTSPIARQIGERLQIAIELMNFNKDKDDQITVQGLSQHLGLADWRILEQTIAGNSQLGAAQLEATAKRLGLNASWLLEGKRTPFADDPSDYGDADDQYKALRRLKPQRVYFVRNKEDPYNSIVVAQVDNIRWATFPYDHPAGPSVGGTGRHQLFEYCCLMRKLHRDYDRKRQVGCFGRQLADNEFMKLWQGEIYPGSLLMYSRNDDWWYDFAELAEERVEAKNDRSIALKEAIYITRHVLAEFQRMTDSPDGWVAKLLKSVGFPLEESLKLDSYSLDH